MKKLLLTAMLALAANYALAGKSPSIIMIEEYKAYAYEYVQQQPRKLATDLPEFTKYIGKKYGPPSASTPSSPLWFLKVPNEEGMCVTLELFQSSKGAAISVSAGVAKCDHPKYAKKGIKPR
ncbi:MAG: hypothetical protein HYS18_13290 [Burkholderiales bacterium]|nr:hypothetical protein [Burkholderiales bacterium]